MSKNGIVILACIVLAAVAVFALHAMQNKAYQDEWNKRWGNSQDVSEETIRDYVRRNMST